MHFWQPYPHPSNVFQKLLCLTRVTAFSMSLWNYQPPPLTISCCMHCTHHQVDPGPSVNSPKGRWSGSTAALLQWSLRSVLPPASQDFHCSLFRTSIFHCMGSFLFWEVFTVCLDVILHLHTWIKEIRILPPTYWHREDSFAELSEKAGSSDHLPACTLKEALNGWIQQPSVSGSSPGLSWDSQPRVPAPAALMIWTPPLWHAHMVVIAAAIGNRRWFPHHTGSFHLA